MNCEAYIELMSAALDGECSAEERRELDAHLAVCPECAALFSILSANAKAARELDCEMPADLKSHIMAALPAQEKPAKQGRVIRWKRWMPVAAAACLVLAVSLFPGTFDSVANETSAPGAIPAPSSLNGNDAAEPRDGSTYGIGDYAEDPQMNNTPAGMPSAAPEAHDPDRYALIDPQAIRVNYGARPDPGAVVVDSVEGLEAYLDGFDSLTWDAEGESIPIAELEALKQTYTADYFRTHRLLCVVVLSGSGSNRYELHSLTRDTVTVLSHIPEEGTCDMAAWLLVAEVDSTFNAGDTLEVEIIREAVSTEYSFSNQQIIRIGNCKYTTGAQIIGSVESLEEYLSGFLIDDNRMRHVFSTAEEFEALQETCKEELFGNYTKRFFRKHHLLCVIVRSPTYSPRYELDSLTRDTVTVLQTQYSFAEGTSQWLLVAEVDTVFNDGDTLDVNIIRK